MVIVLFFMLPVSFLYAQKNVEDCILTVIIENRDEAISGLGFHVYCSDVSGNRLTNDILPVSHSDMVSKYKKGLFRDHLSLPLAIESSIIFPIQFPQIFRDVHVVVEDSDLNDGWIVPKQRISFLEFYKDSAQLRFLPSKGKHNYRESIITIQPIKESTFVQEFLGERKNDAVAMTLLQNSVRLDRRLVERDGWQFEKSWFKVKGKDGGYIQTLYRVRKATQNDWMTILLGEQYENEKSMSIMHPDIRDVNFDGVPDLHVLKGADGLDGFFGINVQSGKFEELFISRLMNLKIDYVLEQVEGDLLEYEEGIDEPLAKVHYQIKGKHYSTVQSKRQELREPAKRLEPKVESGVLFSEIRNDWKYELQKNVVEGSLENQYRRLVIYPKGTSTVLFEDSISPMIVADNQLVDSFFLVVKDYNHDNVPDVYWPKMGPDQSEVFYLSETTDGKLSFNKIEGLSYPEVMMMQGDFSFLTNKMKLQEYDDFNLDGWLDYRVYTQMDKSIGFWSYFIFHTANKSFQYSSEFSMLNHCSVNRKSNDICAWQELETNEGHKRLVRYRLNNGQLVIVK